MRYVVAMVFAIIGAALAAVFLSSDVADWVVDQWTYESPDSADSLHMAAYMIANVAGLFVGWLVGWIVGGARSAGKQPS